MTTNQKNKTTMNIHTLQKRRDLLFWSFGLVTYCTYQGFSLLLSGEQTVPTINFNLEQKAPTQTQQFKTLEKCSFIANDKPITDDPQMQRQQILGFGIRRRSFRKTSASADTSKYVLQPNFIHQLFYKFIILILGDQTRIMTCRRSFPRPEMC